MNDLKLKVKSSALSAGVFLLASVPLMMGKYENRLVLSVAFLVLALLAMKFVQKSECTYMQLLKYAVLGALLFFLMTSYEVRNLVGYNEHTVKGLLVKTAVFWAVVVGFMYLPDGCGHGLVSNTF